MGTVSLEQRLYRFIKFSYFDECWLFMGARNSEGYGYLTIDGQGKRAHRLIWELAYGPIPDNYIVLHTCDNPPCCNLNHLKIGTQLDNMRDRNIKGRDNHAHGTDYRNAKLNDNLAIEILRRKGRQSSRAIGREFNVSHTVILRIWSGTAWTHINRETVT